MSGARPRTVLLTLGRLPKGLDIARALHGAGCRVIVAEPLASHLVGASRAVARSVVVTAPAVDRERYLADLLRVVVVEGVELVVPVSEEIVHVSFLCERLPPGVRLHAMPPEFLLRLHDKRSFIERCAVAGVAAPRTALLGEPAAAEIAATGEWVLKPVLSCSGRGLRFGAAGEPLPVPDGEPRIVQRRVRGELLSSFTIARAGVARATVVYRAAVLDGSVAVCFERVDPPPAILDWVARIVAAERFDGFISFDLILQPDGAVEGIECNPRGTSGLHFVEPGSLAAALLEPDADRPVRLRGERLMQQFYPCLTRTQKSMFRADFRHNLRCLLEARDVTWKRDDPWPLLSMPWQARGIILESLRRGVPFGEVATLDVGWYGGEGARVATPAKTGVS